MTALHLARTVYDAIRVHGEETYPHECCGALLGRSTPEGWWIEASSRPVICEPTQRITGIKYLRQS